MKSILPFQSRRKKLYSKHFIVYEPQKIPLVKAVTEKQDFQFDPYFLFAQAKCESAYH